MKFPSGQKIGPGARRWTPSEIAAFDAAHGIDMPPPEGLIDVKQVARRYGISIPTVYRWATEARAEREA